MAEAIIAGRGGFGRSDPNAGNDGICIVQYYHY